MTSSRAQHVVPAGVVLALAILVAWLSFTQEPADSFLFPRIISVFFVALAIWNFARAALGMAKVGGGIDMGTAGRIFPGLIIMSVTVFWAAKALGFYVACTLAFFLIFSLYDPAPHSQLGSWLRRIVVTVAFMAVIYALFAMLLQVQTPRGIFL
ncbi:tripartite tricarboxylate transporter TctB family protein [Ahrensia sp. R2A130]|uniref:tripartite tricarboxylate transporter TctB family protein n=1 Tax=Ahrensia sp. R2A130 TaxID=744979 RepID=UPI0001E0D842|nr:tripartite tricarboxylate transporter TctB family protein [Ahrensia sp. R2A130]EFL89288.1 conserved hypothetical protein [Ahrensia sp. R2A130]